jgi:hypothetical protein
VPAWGLFREKALRRRNLRRIDMKVTTESRAFQMGICCLLVFLASCATLPYLSLTYRLPSGKSDGMGRSVSLILEDERSTTSILGTGAREEFGSSETVSFAIAEGGGPAASMGVYDYPQLIKEAFRKRLENVGIRVVSGGEPAEAEISIAVQEFFLDLVNRKWQFRMRYEARLLKNGRILASQSVNGEGERLKILGRDQAEEVVGEIFSDTLNQLNPSRLFIQAGL